MSPAGSKNAPEAKAREKIDAQLAQAGWIVQYRDELNLTAGEGIAVGEFKLEESLGQWAISPGRSCRIPTTEGQIAGVVAG